MAVKMRLTRMGDKKSPFYRVVVIDSRKAQSGEYIDKIGYVDPLKTPAEINIDVEELDKVYDVLATLGESFKKGLLAGLEETAKKIRP